MRAGLMKLKLVEALKYVQQFRPDRFHAMIIVQGHHLAFVS